MAVDVTWTDPSTGGAIDLSTGGTLTETIYDKILSNLKRLGGVDGDTKTGDMKFGANIVYINDSANTGMTTGQTINQGGADNEASCWKSSDVAHSATGIMETDSFGTVSKVGATTGGLQLKGVTTGTIGVILQGIGDTDDTTRSSAGAAYIRLDAIKRSGATAGAVGADGNMVAITNNGTTRAIFDQEGELHIDSTLTQNAWDEHDDWKLARALKASLLPESDPWRERYAELVQHYRPVMEKTGLVTYNENGHHFVAMRRVAMFNLDMGFQLGEMFMAHEARFNSMEHRLAIAEQRLAALPAA